MKKGLKISELAKITDVPKSTILFYVKKGLLPEPMKTSPNMAWYSEECIERINFIKEMQNRKFVPLDHIKHLIEHVEQDDLPIQFLLNTHTALFEKKTEDDIEYSREEFLEKAGITAEELDKLKKLQLIICSKNEELYYPEDLKNIENLKNVMKLGLEIEDLSYYPEHIAKIIEKDMEVHHKVSGNCAECDAAKCMEITETLIECARFAREYYFRKMFPLRVIEHIDEHKCNKGKNFKEREE